MSQDYLNGYINGILEGAIAANGKLGYHMVNAACFDRHSYKADLAQMAGCEADDFEIEESWEQPEDMFRALFDARSYGGEIEDGGLEELENSTALADKLLYLLSFELGSCEYVMRFNDEDEVRENASGYMGGWGPFYYMEAMFFIMFEKAAVLFMIGNDE